MSTESIFNENEGAKLIRSEINKLIVEEFCSSFPVRKEYKVPIYCWVLLIFESFDCGDWLSKIDIYLRGSIKGGSERGFGFIYAKDWNPIESIDYIISLICSYLQKPLNENYQHIKECIEYWIYNLYGLNKEAPKLKIKKERKKRDWYIKKYWKW